jgi:putative ABC transport system permease protein
MKSLTRGHLKAGLDSVRGAKMRNFWTMLGVIIGVASVITVVGIGEGIKQQIGGQVHHLGKDLITVQPSQLHSGAGSRSTSANLLSGLNITGTLSTNDVTTVSKSSGVGQVAPLSAVSGSIVGDHGSYSGGLVLGTTSALSSLLNQSMEYGVFLSDSDVGSNVAVLGTNAAKQLFDEDVPLGRTFSIHGQQFMVRGIFNEFDNTPFSPEADYNNAIFIPYDVSESMTNGSAPTFEILARPINPAQTSAVAASVRSDLQAAHGGNSDFSVLQQNQNLAANNDILDLLTRLIAGVAAISLLVGGIGIMNVMLVSVAERMHEIGIRKAVGATNSQILSQFMIEASVLSLSGGLIGIGLAYLIDISLRVFTNLRPAISWQVVVLATGVSLLVGIVFGSVPALKAARKDPIDALRSE